MGGASRIASAKRGLACSLFAAACSVAAWGQQSGYREFQVLDRDSDEWVEGAPASAPASQPADELTEYREMLRAGEEDRAASRLRKWLKANPDHELANDARFLLGEALFLDGQFQQAYEQYELVADSVSGELFYRTLRREMDVARAFLSGRKRIVWKVFRFPAYDDGIKILDRVWERAPGTRLAEEALRLKADFRYARGEMDLAQDEYALLASEYPQGRFSKFAGLRGAESAAAQFSGVRYDDRPLLEADERYHQLGATAPDYAARERVELRRDGIVQQRAEKELSIAAWYERIGQPGAAEFYYRAIVSDWPDTLAAVEARTRLRAMGVDLESAPAGEEEP